MPTEGNRQSHSLTFLFFWPQASRSAVVRVGSRAVHAAALAVPRPPRRNYVAKQSLSKTYIDVWITGRASVYVQVIQLAGRGK
eukprot:4189589-Heterocapsa_arctica.AAC.1